jgi:hypothetical protein
MLLQTEPYERQRERWPAAGRLILAHFNEGAVVVYQAYRPAIGLFAAHHGHFGGEFSFTRMSWIKPNFLWMMYRCGWGTKPDQQVVLAVHLRRSAFDEILTCAVHSTFDAGVYGTHEHWKEQLAESPVRLQWDPDHAPNGAKQQRRALQLGLSGQVLRQYARDWIVDIEDISEFVRRQRLALENGADGLVTPSETVYPVQNPEVAKRLGIDQP